MTEFDIASNNVPLGNTAVANLFITDGGNADDVATIRVVLKSNTGATLSDETWSGVDVADTATDGGAITITDPAGTGTYKWTYAVPNDGTYAPTVDGLTFSITVTVTDEVGEGAGTKTDVFFFKIVPEDITISLDTAAVSSVVRRRAGLIKDIPYLAEGAETAASLVHDIIYGIESATLNGTTITNGTEYSHVSTRPNVTFPAGEEPAANDWYVFRCKVRLDDTALSDYVRQAEREVLSALRPFFSDSALLTSPTIVNLLIERIVGQIRMELAEGVALENAQYRTGRDQVTATNQMLRMLARGEAHILNSSGSRLTRTAGSLVGAFRHSDGAIEDAQDLRSRLAQWDRIALQFMPLSATIEESQ